MHPTDSRRRAVQDLRSKIRDSAFRHDLDAPVAPWPDGYSIEGAADLVIEELLAAIP